MKDYTDKTEPERKKGPLVLALAGAALILLPVLSVLMIEAYLRSASRFADKSPDGLDAPALGLLLVGAISIGAILAVLSIVISVYLMIHTRSIHRFHVLALILNSISLTVLATQSTVSFSVLMP